MSGIVLDPWFIASVQSVFITKEMRQWFGVKPHRLWSVHVWFNTRLCHLLAVCPSQIIFSEFTYELNWHYKYWLNQSLSSGSNQEKHSDLYQIFMRYEILKPDLSSLCQSFLMCRMKVKIVRVSHGGKKI